MSGGLYAPGARPARTLAALQTTTDDANRRRRQTPTDDSVQNNTGPLGEPVIICATNCIQFIWRLSKLHSLDSALFASFRRWNFWLSVLIKCGSVPTPKSGGPEPLVPLWIYAYAGVAEGSQKWGGTDKRGQKGRSLRPEGPLRRVGFLERGAVSHPPHQLWGLGSSVSCKLSGVRGKAPTVIDFLVFLIPQIATTWGLTVFDGKMSEESRAIACLLALKSEEARASVPHRLRHLRRNNQPQR